MLGLSILLLTTTGNVWTFMDTWVPLLFLVNATVVFGAMAHFFDVLRFWAFGPAFGLPLVLDSWLMNVWDVKLPGELIFGLVGALVVIVGAVTLRRFVRAYPVRRQTSEGHETAS